MKLLRKLSLLLTVTVLISCFSGIGAFAALAPEIIDSGAVIYRADFEDETKADSTFPSTFMVYDYPNKAYAPAFASAAVVVKDSVSADPERIGNKYMLTGVSQSGGDLKSGDSRVGAPFSQEIKGGYLRIEFDAAIYDDSAVTGEYVNLGLAGKSGNTWFFGGNCAIGYISASLNNGNEYANGRLFNNGAWNHYICELDLTNGKASLTVNNVTYTKDLAMNDTYMGITNYSPTASNMALDNFEVTYSSTAPVKRTVLIDETCESGSYTNFFELLGPLGAHLSHPKILDTSAVGTTEEAPIATVYEGNYDLGNKVSTTGLDYAYRINTGSLTSGVLKMEMDALVTNGGFGLIFGSNANGGAMGSRVGLAYQRATRQFVAVPNANSGGWYDSATDAGEVVLTYEGTEEPIKYVKNKWTHLILEIDTATGVTVATIDGMRSNPYTLNFAKTAPITSAGFGFRLADEAYNGAKDHTAFIDNMKVTIETGTSIDAVCGKNGKLFIDFAKDINPAISDADIKVVGGTVSSVRVSGDKLVAEVSGLNDGLVYVAELSENVTFTDGTKPGVGTYHFTYDASGLDAASQIIVTLVNYGTVDNSQALMNVDAALTNDTVYGYLATYDADNNLLAVKENPVELTEFDYLKKAYHISLDTPVKSGSPVKTVKVFTWDENMIPYATADVETVN